VWAAIAWLLAVAGGGVASMPIVKALLRRRSNPPQIEPLAFVWAWWRLKSLGLYARIETRFLKRHPEEAGAAAKVKGKLHEQLGLSTGPGAAETKPAVGDATLRDVDRSAL
jgi:hypothetical protein